MGDLRPGAPRPSRPQHTCGYPPRSHPKPAHPHTQLAYLQKEPTKPVLLFQPQVKSQPIKTANSTLSSQSTET